MDEAAKPTLVIVTGASGAGKTTFLYTLEELGFYIVENTPVSLMDALFGEFEDHPDKYPRVALSVSLQVAEATHGIALRHKGIKTIFQGLDCSIPVLIERFKLTRRIHPLQHEGLTLLQALHKDANDLAALKERFDYYLDTTKTTGSQLRKYIYDVYIGFERKRLNVVFVSFGYKKVIPQDLDIILDTRMLPNPYWTESLRDLTGLDKPVVDYVLDNDIARDYLKHVTDFLDFYLGQLEKEHRPVITIGFGCSGGQHRSVVVAEYFKRYYARRFQTIVVHRDIPG